MVFAYLRTKRDWTAARVNGGYLSVLDKLGGSDFNTGDVCCQT